MSQTCSPCSLPISTPCRKHLVNFTSVNRWIDDKSYRRQAGQVKMTGMQISNTVMCVDPGAWREGLDLSWEGKGSVRNVMLGTGCRRLQVGLLVNSLISVPSHTLPSALHTFAFLGLLASVALMLKYFPELKELTVYTEDSALLFNFLFYFSNDREYAESHRVGI